MWFAFGNRLGEEGRIWAQYADLEANLRQRIPGSTQASAPVDPMPGGGLFKGFQQLTEGLTRMVPDVQWVRQVTMEGLQLLEQNGLVHLDP